jgi:hypothetical protein
VVLFEGIGSRNKRAIGGEMVGHFGSMQKGRGDSGVGF